MKKVLLVVLVMVLSACQKTPETESSVGMSSDDKESLVTSTPALDSSESESPKQEEKDGYALITLEQARMEAKEMAGQTVEGFIMPEKIVVTDGNTIPVYKDSEHQCESYKEAEECFRKLIPRYGEIVAAGAEPRYYYDEENPESVAGVTYKIESDNDYGMEIATVSDKGFISYDGKIVSFMWEPEERYDIEWGDSYTDDEGYELSDGFVTIKDAIEFTEKRINDSLGELYEGVDKFKVQHLYVFKNEKNGKYVYKMIVGFVFDGQALDTASLYYDSKGGKDKYTFAGFYLNCVMEKSDCLDSFTNGNCSVDFEKIENVDKVISPKTALKIIKKELALGGIDGFGQAGLISFCKARDLDYGESLTEEELKEAGVFRPYWVFTNRRYYMRDNTGGNYDAHENTVFVDAVTGSVFFCNLTSPVPG